MNLEGKAEQSTNCHSHSQRLVSQGSDGGHALAGSISERGLASSENSATMFSSHSQYFGHLRSIVVGLASGQTKVARRLVT